jgi:hypothetical protein
MSFNAEEGEQIARTLISFAKLWQKKNRSHGQDTAPLSQHVPGKRLSDVIQNSALSQIASA